MGKKVSIILPVYNVEKYLPRCIDSILAQTMPKDELEVIFVDDGSKDGSGKLLDTHAAQYSHFKVIHQTNAGAAAARNAGLKIATGEYVAFVDPDDYIDEKYCQEPYEEGVRNGADIVLFDALKETSFTDKYGKEETKVISLSHAEKSFVTTSSEDILSMCCQILYPYMKATAGGEEFKADVPLAAPWDKLYKREFLIGNNLHFQEDLKVLDDMCFNYIAFSKAGKVSYIPKALYHYQVWQTSITNSYKKDRPLQDMKVFDFIKKNIEGQKDTDNRLRQAYYARIIKSFAICCRLYFFNIENPGNNKERLSEIKNYMSKEPYSSAFRNVRLGSLEWKLVIVALAGKCKSAWIMRLLHMLQNR
nr:glycosyltransferase [uncultured Butyrivibrio sp.]